MKEATKFSTSKIDSKPNTINITDDNHLIFNQWKKYVHAIDMQELKTRIKTAGWDVAAYLAQWRAVIRTLNNKQSISAEIWIEKESVNKFAKYRVAEA